VQTKLDLSKVVSPLSAECTQGGGFTT